LGKTDLRAGSGKAGRCAQSRAFRLAIAALTRRNKKLLDGRVACRKAPPLTAARH